MKLKILGTCAAEGWPALFCDCPACRKARKLGGKNIRTRSSLQIDKDLKIDFPPDTMSHIHKYGLELYNLKYLLISHSHSDHLAAHDLEFMMEPFALPPVYESLKIYGNGASINRIRNAQTEKVSGQSGLLNEVHPFQELNLPPYKISTLKAMHKPDEESLNYIIEKDGKRVLYACDTGYYEPSTWEFLSGRKTVDLVICECTGGPDKVSYKHHMGFPNVLSFKEKAEEIGLTGPESSWVLTHFSHGGGMMHNELEELVKPEGFEIAWDGMEIQL